MSHTKQITFNKSCPSIKFNADIEPKPVPWLFIETGYYPKKRSMGGRLTSQVSLPPKHMTFGNDYMFANSTIPFTKQEMNVINTAERRQDVEIEMHNDVSRVNLAKQINAQSKIEFETLLQRQQEEANLKKKQAMLFKDPEGEELITARSSRSTDSLLMDSSRNDVEVSNNEIDDKAYISKLEKFDGAQVKKMIFQSITPATRIRGSHFSKSEFSFGKNDQLEKRVSGGMRNIQRAITSMADPNEYNVAKKLDSFPDPRDSNLPSINRMNKFYANC
ncbi:hypothetical protein TVAG_061830 [Trichomonas vaginalis G3]|uniref:KRAB domain-containing protein n=1 Tax=Trichomonas vaginalis (strain ATCC PRA-98 / G3) TaxID=412133 RepID=A2E7U8_TRIV3|nr:hypothetical protein TVAGG3_0282680 [Trichomonas vaginalis G3]EAY11279.1 hypothetical protein TVAG_061830 [Trichomonas vaginalis G3]KAI5526679.1 hypothetical protein TVAGG3_0282680 [Trichomonas vaginalis G3]|eukprot:XP_001323502.1 hypothetical protein [Trichomonas vaginalis G3]